MKKEFLRIEDLHVSIKDKHILRGINLTIFEGEKHLLMGPNGSGKSTLVKVLANHPDYRVLRGKIIYKGKDILKFSPEERAKMGIFIGFQHPIEILKVNNFSFLHTIYQSLNKDNQKTIEDFSYWLDEKMKELSIPSSFKDRNMNEGFSGGERKRNEILQMIIANPSIAILDEIDSGLDLDALKIIFKVIEKMFSSNRSLLLISHYPKVFDHIKIDVVHVMSDGKWIKIEDVNQIESLEKNGYERFIKENL